jgi:tetratricopeptide (TPR) repeat protein
MYGTGKKGEDRDKTVPVGSFPANAFGLFEMHGNVMEWCADAYRDNYIGAPNDGSARAAGDSTYRVVRGGSWGQIPRFLRSANRLWVDPTFRIFDLGIRLARTVSPLTSSRRPMKRLVGRTGELFVDQCFGCDWTELDETRTMQNEPELKLVADLYRYRGYDETLAHLEKIWPRYPDHDFLYFWKARLLSMANDKTNALEVLREGLRKCPKKHRLCSEIGTIEYNRGNLDQGIIWWIRSAISQISGRGPIYEEPFLYLAYVARALGDKKSSEQLFEVVDRVMQINRASGNRLNADAAGRLMMQVVAQNDGAIGTAIKLLCRQTR